MKRNRQTFYDWCVNNNKSTWNQSKIANKDISSLMSGIDLAKVGVRSNGEGVSLIQNKAGLFVTDNNNYNASAYSRSIPNEIMTTAEDENGNLGLMVPEKDMPAGAEIC